MSSLLGLAAQNNITEQFGRVFKLLVSDAKGESLDLSNLRVKFAIKKSSAETPNVADIRVYNVDLEFAQLIKKQFTKVIMQAGYVANFGVIFSGNVKQIIIGRESATDTYVDIIAGDGDQAYNFAIVNTTLAKGSSQADHLNAATAAMTTQGTTAGFTSALPTTKLPRGKVMFGTARDHIRTIADSSGCSWSIQDEQIEFVKQTTYLPGTAVVLTSKTGIVGTPQQTNQGVNLKCLLNPKIKSGRRIQIDNKSIEQLKINFAVPGSPANLPAPLTADGVYYVLVVEHSGDTRGVEWYSNLITLNVSVTSNPLNSVSNVS